MSETCDLCGKPELEFAYQPEDTQRALSAHICTHCGLVQSLPRQDSAPRAEVSISSGADWGNLRYGKGFRIEAHKALFAALGLPVRPRILDVGANRGAFIEAALATWPDAQITAVEPDERVIAAYAARPQVQLINKRIEACDFTTDSFDLIYSSHTLEHLASPRATLQQHFAALSDRGQLLLEVPDIAILGSPDIVEEWFIDKHLAHFSGATLASLLSVTGFDIVRGPIATAHEHLTVIARKDHAPLKPAVADPTEVRRARALIAAYRAARTANAAALKIAARALNADKGRIVVWGAGRLFDALVRVGGFRPSALAGLIDEGLRAHCHEHHGLPLLPADELGRAAPDLVVIASRSFAAEIEGRAKELAPNARILTFSQLIERSRRAA
jgi:SAM-dependent methyltransferase